MQKNLMTVVILLLLGVGGFFGFQQYQVIQARKVAQAQAAVAAARARAQAAEAAAKLRAQQAAAQAALEVARKDVETQLKTLKVSSIMLGDPALAIIARKEYAGGDLLTLPQGGKTLRVTAVREDGVFLAYNGLAFHLDPPAAPDLDALRKPR